MRSSREAVIQPNEETKPELPNPEKCFLWKLSLKRKDAFEAMNDDVDAVVNQCIKARQHLQALEDSNRNLYGEMRSLKRKYEALLEKNKKDTGIIMNLKDSESKLKEARKNQEDAKEALLSAKMTCKAKSLERQLLQDDLAKILFKSQTISNSINKINIKHKRVQDMIEEQNKKGKENEKQLSEEIEDLQLNLSKSDNILEEWQEDNTKRDAAIRNLQDDMKQGLMAKAHEDHAESDIDQNSSNADVPATDESETDQSAQSNTSTETDSKKTKKDEKKKDVTAEKKKAVRREWSRKKVLYEVAEKQKEHWTDIFMLINKRMQDLSIEVVNVREWRIDAQVQKQDLLQKVEELEKLVSQKRRKKPVPDRTSIDELKIWIKMQHQVNDVIRRIAFKYLSIKIEDWAMYSEFSKTVRDMYLEVLEQETALEETNEEETEKRTEETQNQT